MTKKAKRKALKTGCKDPKSGRYITSVHLGLQVNSTKQEEEQDHSSNEKWTRKKQVGKSLKGNVRINRNLNGKEYPLDLWYHISKWITPEQIKTFSLICLNSWNITCTLQFWLTIYHKFVPYSENLPLSLLPHNIDARPGIKPRVVRALFLNYTPFRGRYIEDTSSKIIYNKCLQFWWEKEYSTKRYSKTWTYLLKFNSATQGNKFQSLNTVCSNSEKNNCILKAKCPNFIYLPSITGMILSSFNFCMSSDMRYHQLKMIFHNERRDGKYHRNEGLLFVINPVMELDVLDWWHPSYPYLI